MAVTSIEEGKPSSRLEGLPSSIEVRVNGRRGPHCSQNRTSARLSAWNARQRMEGRAYQRRRRFSRALAFEERVRALHDALGNLCTGGRAAVSERKKELSSIRLGVGGVSLARAGHLKVDLLRSADHRAQLASGGSRRWRMA